MHSLAPIRRRLSFGMILFLALAAAIPAHAQRKAPAFQVTQGATDDQVFQRNDNNQADIALSGTATLRGAARVRARVQRRHVTVEGFDWKDVANVAKGGAWKATLKGLPVGGPYNVDLQLVDRRGNELAATGVRSLLVGDLWILAGQSNMQGVGNLVNTEPTSHVVHSFNMRDEWVIAEDPLHSRPDAADSVHWGQNDQGEPVRLTGAEADAYHRERTRGAGLGLDSGHADIRLPQRPRAIRRGVAHLPARAEPGVRRVHRRRARADPSLPGRDGRGAGHGGDALDHPASGQRREHGRSEPDRGHDGLLPGLRRRGALLDRRRPRRAGARRGLRHGGRVPPAHRLPGGGPHVALQKHFYLLRKAIQKYWDKSIRKKRILQSCAIPFENRSEPVLDHGHAPESHQ